MNITGVSLFPGIDGVDRKIAEAAKIRFQKPDSVDQRVDNHG